MNEAVIRYKIEGKLGAGGMGEVFLAQDVVLQRQVALKKIKGATDAEAKRRFLREARAASALNHPHIVAVYDLAVQDGVDYLVMEYVPGKSLDRLLSPKGLPLDEAAGYAQQVASALAAAYGAGIVHRDIKPANVMVLPEGSVKVLDFGLAKLLEAPGGEDGETRTLAPCTQADVVMGTVPYMSPEQAQGRPLDQRTDIFSLGVMLYEMIAGVRPFRGKSAAETMHAIIHDSLPPLEQQPMALEEILAKALAKDPRERYQHAGDLALDLRRLPKGLDTGAQVRASVAGPRTRWVIPVVLAVVALAGGWWMGWLAARAAPPAGAMLTRTVIALPQNQKLASGSGVLPLAVTPDGRRIAYVAEKDALDQLYVREMSALEAKLIPGTAGAKQPFFSPDGEWIGFFGGGALQKVAVAGGAPLRICNLSGLSMGGSWGPDQTIVFAMRGEALRRVNAGGGEPQVLPGTKSAAWPEILPGGKTVLYTTTGKEGIATVELAGGAPHIVGRLNDARLEGPAVFGAGGLAQAHYVRTGHLVYGQSPGIVRAAVFDLASLALTGSPVSVIDEAERARDSGGVYFGLSQNGLLVYAPTGDRHQLVWVDRKGTPTPVSDDRMPFRGPRISPDGKQIAIAINDETRRSDIWLYDAERGTKARLTNEAHNLAPLWTPDGSHVTFSAGAIFEVPATGAGVRKMLVPVPRGEGRYPTSWSPDGRTLLLETFDRIGPDLMVWTGSGEPRSLFPPSKNAHEGSFSPLGEWMVYTSDESGRNQIYAVHYPDLGGRVSISSDGGEAPKWARDGREVFYRQGDALMAVSIEVRGKELRAGNPRRLFDGPYSGAGRELSFDVSPDGKRFAMVRSDEAATLRQLVVVQNWFEELKRRAPAK